MEDEVHYVIDFNGERPKGRLVDATQAMVDELDAAQPEVFETIEAAMRCLFPGEA